MVDVTRPLPADLQKELVGRVQLVTISYALSMIKVQPAGLCLQDTALYSSIRITSSRVQVIADFLRCVVAA